MSAIPQLTYDEWMAEGTRRFGNDFLDWRFVCPICGHVAAVRDYRPFKAQGATPDSATQECIGRYTGSGQRAFGADDLTVGLPCDYALYGLFRLPGVQVAMPDGTTNSAFAFADPA